MFLYYESELKHQLDKLEISTLVGLYSYEIKYSFDDKCHLASVKEFYSLMCDANVFSNNRSIPLYHLDFIIEDIQRLVCSVIEDLVDYKEDIPLPEWVNETNKAELFKMVGLECN